MVVKFFFLFPENDDSILCICDEPQKFKNFLKGVSELFSAISKYKKQNRKSDSFYDGKNADTFLQKIEEILRVDKAEYYLTNSIKQFRLMLQKTGSRNWRDEFRQDGTCCYVLWNFHEFKAVPVTGGTLAEICERILSDKGDNIKYLLININNSIEINRAFLPVFKDCSSLNDPPNFVQIDFVCDEKQFEYWRECHLGKIRFTLRNTQKFIKTGYIEQGQAVYKEISTQYYWYLDNLHKYHYEVFDSTGRHIGIADLDGTIDTDKRIEGRKIKVN